MVESMEWGAPLLPWMVEAANTLGFPTMTAVQAAAIPLLAGNKDVVAEAVTGSGKTLAFLFPLLVRLSRIEERLRSGQTNAIIIEPTRELAYQTHRVLRELVDLAPDPKLIRTQLVTGGNTTSAVADVKNFLQLKPHVVVATPGRLLELLRAQHVNTRAVDLLVLDEGDRLLSLDVDQTVSTILQMLPKQKRVALFSATMNDNLMRDIVKMGMRNPVKVKVSSPAHTTPDRLVIKHHNYGTDPVAKIPLAIHLLQSTEYRKAIVYIPTCTSVTYWYHVFKLFVLEPKFYSLHGKLQQGPRLRTLANFTESLDKCVLLTTDVAARGLDIPEVDFVLQLDPPHDPNMFVHRAGRTGRAGRRGLCSVLLNGDLEQNYVDFMHVRKVPIADAEAVRPVLSADDYVAKLQHWVRTDRAHHDLAIRSFLSFVRYYMKHTATSIFRLSSIDLFQLAKSFGVLKMPRMPELKNKELPNDGWLTPQPFDMDAELKYTDAKQEQARQAKLAKRAAEDSNSAAKAEAAAAAAKHRKQMNSQAWSANLERKDKSQARREKRQRRAISIKEAQQRDAGNDSDSDGFQQDWKVLVQERKSKKSKPNPEFSFDL